MVVGFLLRVFSAVLYYLHTAILFTWTDYKTIFLPITVFACATAPVRSFTDLLQCWVWVWFHQLLCNVSNQARSREEDRLNRPWRPLPSGRISESQAYALRWATVLLCIFISSIYDQDLVLTTLGLVVTTFIYDELGAAGNVIGKALCTAGGYASFELGATTIIGANHEMDSVSVTAVIISGILIFTAIQAQDFPDVEGDKAVGRMTFPIYAPELSRLLTLFATVAWSIFLSWFWGVGPISTTAFISFGIHVGMRYYLWRTLEADRKSYLIFNVWLMAAHVLPLHARTSVLAF
ncbi:UbiA prenyltransferase family [Multifurca ochricompacta]|uniref:UbiA prenyltransferase family n=1 Tax=Multifurca ochricompacta TaxID=376703 RepID=A0AAD4M5H8_9AGAM|nr:UbiA prenyltransferase family [Multifurca ochricompacta]